MSKRPTDVDEPPAKKRGSNRQLTKDDESEEEVEEPGIFQQAPEEVLAKRRIVKARRGTGAPPPTPSGGPPAASSNPFAGVSLTGSLQASNGFAALAKNTAAPELSKEPASAQAATNAAVGKKQEAEEPPVSEASEAASPADGTQAATSTSEAATAVPSFGSFAAAAGSSPWTTASTGTAFGFAGTGLAAEKATTAAAGPEEPSRSASISKKDAEEVKPSSGFSFNTSAPGGGFSFGTLPASGGFPCVQSIFGSKAPAPQPPASNGSASASGSAFEAKAPTLPEETETVTGEEEEETLWAGEGTLYEFDAARQWRERGKGEMRINRAPGRAARFVMRQRGFLRLLMNANLWPEMKVTPMDGGKGATFSVMNAAKAPEDHKDEAESKLQTFAFRIKAVGRLDEFIIAIDTNKVGPSDKVPENKVQGDEAV